MENVHLLAHPWLGKKTNEDQFIQSSLSFDNL